MVGFYTMFYSKFLKQVYLSMMSLAYTEFIGRYISYPRFLNNQNDENPYRACESRA